MLVLGITPSLMQILRSSMWSSWLGGSNESRSRALISASASIIQIQYSRHLSLSFFLHVKRGCFYLYLAVCNTWIFWLIHFWHLRYESCRNPRLTHCRIVPKSFRLYSICSRLLNLLLFTDISCLLDFITYMIVLKIDWDLGWLFGQLESKIYFEPTSDHS